MFSFDERLEGKLSYVDLGASNAQSDGLALDSMQDQLCQCGKLLEVLRRIPRPASVVGLCSAVWIVRIAAF